MIESSSSKEVFFFLKITEERGMRLGKDVNLYLAEVAIPLISHVQMQTVTLNSLP